MTEIETTTAVPLFAETWLHTYRASERKCYLQRRKNLDKTTETELICHPPLAETRYLQRPDYIHIEHTNQSSWTKARWTLSLPQTSRANPAQCYSTHQEKFAETWLHTYRASERKCYLQRRKNLDKTTETELICHPPLAETCYLQRPDYEVATTCRLLKIMGLFCRI